MIRVGDKYSLSVTAARFIWGGRDFVEPVEITITGTIDGLFQVGDSRLGTLLSKEFLEDRAYCTPLPEPPK